MVVVFPPQAFAERAYKEDSLDGGETPELPPVPARAAAPTRLGLPGTARAATSRSPSKGCSTGTRWSPSWCRPRWDRPPLCRRPRSWPRTGRRTSPLSRRRGPPRQRSRCPTGSCCRPIRPAAGCPPPPRAGRGRPGRAVARPARRRPDEPGGRPSTRVRDRRYAPSGRRTTRPRGPRAGRRRGRPWGLSSLSPNWRHQIVRLTSDGTLTLPVRIRPIPVPPVPIDVSRLHLTALGASLTSHFAWTVSSAVLPVEDLGGVPPLPEGLNVSDWRHVDDPGP